MAESPALTSAPRQTRLDRRQPTHSTTSDVASSPRRSSTARVPPRELRFAVGGARAGRELGAVSSSDEEASETELVAGRNCPAAEPDKNYSTLKANSRLK